ncbi:GAF domain-containing protein [Gorillibacterium timonense]|uniref:GAF domain-containing protein n=1 Tax=Gorillibacterium timonense TaxID=1689269 RepID=UPI00071DF0D4|nr:GAF domain-containing protein [Gorillibacterium timonense]
MFQKVEYASSRLDGYRLVQEQLRHLIQDEPDAIANLANASALLGHFLEEINWVGFYLVKDGELVLGPFQGLPACVRIPVGKGVCGTAAQDRSTVKVDDVHAFPGHIACDAASNSEIVVPLLKGGVLIGVLDIDSPLHARFDETDREQLERFCSILVEAL